MYYLEKIKQQLAEEINKFMNTEAVSAADFVAPPDPTLGDLSLPCFMLAKELKQSPVAAAQAIAAGVRHEAIASIMAAGPYANIVLAPGIAAAVLVEISFQPQQYGNNMSGGEKRVMLEFANGNTHKEMHIGHLRNVSFGDAVTRILAANGFRAIPVSYINDFGIHVAKTIWWMYHPDNAHAAGILQSEIKDKGYFLGTQYAAAVAEIAKRPEAKEEVGKVMQAIESRQGEWFEKWEETRRWSIDYMQEINEELALRFGEIYYESDFLEAGLKMVQELQEKGLLVPSQGAIIADLEKYDLGVLVVLRSDGTALYPVADLALAVAKVEKHKLDLSLYVVDVRQSQYFKQLFKVLELMGVSAGFAHLPYDFVTLPSGMMSSRSGNIIRYEELKDATLRRTIEETAKRHEDWSPEKIEETARVIALGALKFEMIKVSGDKVIVFDMDTALRFEGFTAAYLQYTYARIQSIQRKAPADVLAAAADYEALTEARERRLILALASFPEAVMAAGAAYQPTEIARTVYELAQLFNDYYHGVPILNGDNLPAGLIKARLELAQSVASVIKRGLELLGIATVEEM